MDIFVNSNALETAKQALRVGTTKLPVACVITQETLGVPVSAA
jgi:ribosomal protein L16/L10AE